MIWVKILFIVASIQAIRYQTTFSKLWTCSTGMSCFMKHFVKLLQAVACYDQNKRTSNRVYKK